MSLRLQINLIITIVMALFAALLITLQIDNTRRSVQEEVEAANTVARQILGGLGGVGARGGEAEVAGITALLRRVGRIRANDATVLDRDGTVIYRSPPSPYKAGREAPRWYAGLVSPPVAPREIKLRDGKLILVANPSRATLDGWDDMLPLLGMVLAGFGLANVLIYALLGHAMRPLYLAAEGLRRMQSGDFSARLPALRGHEGRMISEAFNKTAASVEESTAAKRRADDAARALAANRETARVVHDRIEQERSAIARELHDEIGQQITAIKSIGQSLANRPEGSAAGRAAGSAQAAARLIVECSDRMYEGVHRIVGRLRPLALDHFGLADALDDLLGTWRMQHPDIAFTLKTEGEVDALGAAAASAAYRIVQEAVTNALRHAGAAQISIALRMRDTVLLLAVEDDGQGRPEALQAPGRFGVVGMRERAEALGGTLAVEAATPRGVRIMVKLPTSSDEGDKQRARHAG